MKEKKDFYLMTSYSWNLDIVRSPNMNFIPCKTKNYEEIV